MNPYDQAHILANVLRKSEEYAAYCAAKEKAFALEANVKLIKRYKKEQFRAQAAHMAGEKIPEAVCTLRNEPLSSTSMVRRSSAEAGLAVK